MTSSRQASLNYKEINLLLAECDLNGAHVRGFYQPEPEILIIELYIKRRAVRVCFVMSQRACRFHLYSRQPAKGEAIQRFVSFLYARLKEAVIESVKQVGRERILKMVFVRGQHRSLLWVRLWSSAPNIIFTDERGRIGDALFRRPKKNEVSGGYYNPEEAFRLHPPPAPDEKRFSIRDFGGEENRSLHERVEAYFNHRDAEEKEITLRDRLLNRLAVEERRLEKALQVSRKWLGEHRDCERLKQCGDILMSDLGRVNEGDRWYRGNDFFNGDVPIEIALNPELSPAQNAQEYYRRYKKMKASCERAKQETESATHRLDDVRATIGEIMETADEHVLERLSEKWERKTVKPPVKGSPGLAFVSGPYTILVGRTAKENEELYRRHVRGNDVWMHTRDFPGASVFIRSIKSKSIPLEVMIDAANLALFYSKAKSDGKADLYYTHVKYLKKAKNGKTGLFLPAHEKNFSVRLDGERIKRLKGIQETFN